MMSLMRLKKYNPKHILVISMTNIGDVVLTCPVIDVLRRDFPEAQMDVIVGPKAVSLFEGHPILKVNRYDKRAPFRQKIKWFLGLSAQRYDMVIDFRHTILPLVLRSRYRTPTLFQHQDPSIVHKRDVHLNRLRQVYDFGSVADERQALVTSREDEEFFAKELMLWVGSSDFAVIAPGAADSAKRWSNPQGFAQVADNLSARYKIVFVGDAADALIIADIQRQMTSKSLSLAGKINLRQLAYVLQKASWALTHDSGVMHVASYFNVPLVVLWGPTDISKYGPWSSKFVVVRRHDQCVRCRDPKDPSPHNCMSFIKVDDVMQAVTALQTKR